MVTQSLRSPSKPSASRTTSRAGAQAWAYFSLVDMALCVETDLTRNSMFEFEHGNVRCAACWAGEVTPSKVCALAGRIAALRGATEPTRNSMFEFEHGNVRCEAC